MVTRNPQQLPQGGKWLALDPGTARVGAAGCNSMRTVATPKGVWPRPWQQLKPLLVKEKEAGTTAIIMGLPLNMDGSEGPSATAATSLASLIEKELGLPVLLFDERLTSKQAESAFFEQRTHGSRQTRASKKHSAGHVDATAATLLLQTVLDTLR